MNIVMGVINERTLSALGLRPVPDPGLPESLQYFTVWCLALWAILYPKNARFDSWRSPNFHYGHLLWLFLWTGVVTLLGEIVHGTLCTTLSSVCHIAISVMVMPEITRSLFCKARVSCYLGLCLLVPAFLAHRTRPTLHPWCLCTCKLVIRSTAFNIFHDSFMF